MKQQIVERARGIVETVLGKPYTGAAPDVMSVNPEVDSYGDGFFWTYLKYDDGNPKCLSDPSARLRLTDRLRTELLGADVKAFPVVSFIAESEVEPDGRSGRLPVRSATGRCGGRCTVRWNTGRPRHTARMCRPGSRTRYGNSDRRSRRCRVNATSRTITRTDHSANPKWSRTSTMFNRRSSAFL